MIVIISIIMICITVVLVAIVIGAAIVFRPKNQKILVKMLHRGSGTIELIDFNKIISIIKLHDGTVRLMFSNGIKDYCDKYEDLIKILHIYDYKIIVDTHK